MPRLSRLALAWLILGAGVRLHAASEVPSPESHLGFRPGADFRLASWPMVVDYFHKVDAASDRVTVRELGRTTEDRPYLAAFISAPETLRNLPRYQGLQRALSNPRLVAPADAGNFDPIADSKAVVVITCTIHSTETASTLMALELLHELTTRDDPVTREILDSTILILVPSANPDGVDKVAQWYERSKGHPWEGSGMPELYHKYAGHDTNRDWFMLNLQETRLLTRLLYKEWFPTILYDVHQMGSRGARLFVPPFFDPINPNLNPRIHQSIFSIGAHMAADLAAAGKRGILTNAMYDNWWNGGNRTTPQRHNIVAVLTEAASVKLATPIFLEESDLQGGSRGFRDHAPAVNFVDPWPGGWWRLRDIVDDELICARSLLTLAARYKTRFQENLRTMGREAIAKGEQEPPSAWVVPADQRDPGTAVAMLRILSDTGVEVRRAAAPFRADGVDYPAGCWVLPAAQPYRSHLKDMMERQVYPSRFTAKGEPETPYDVAGWTLPLQMGVRSAAVSERLNVATELLTAVEPMQGGRSKGGPGTYPAIELRSNDDFIVLNALLDAGIDVRVDRAKRSLLLPADARTDAVLDRVLPTVSCRVGTRGAPPSIDRASLPHLQRGRLGVYQPWMPSMDEGWTRLVLEKFHFPYVTLHNAQIRAGDLKERIDTLLIPSIKTKSLRDGYGENQTESAYVGGLGDEGEAALRTFVDEGGTLVCLEHSCDYVIAELGLPVSNVLKGLKSAQFYAPGSIVRAEHHAARPDVAAGSILGYGMPDQFSAYFDQSLAFSVRNPSPTSGMKVSVAAQYTSKNPLESGWLLGPEMLQQKAALVEISQGKGRVVLFAFPPQHRGQTHGTFRLLFTALYRADDERTR